jgi:hypothetical protein
MWVAGEFAARRAGRLSARLLTDTDTARTHQRNKTETPASAAVPNPASAISAMNYTIVQPNGHEGIRIIGPLIDGHRDLRSADGLLKSVVRLGVENRNPSIKLP